ncbi:uncharacterized protein AAG666_022915 isoform 1-T1 [Megaptera novaeangliae]
MSASGEHGWSQSTPKKVHTCRGLQKTLQDHTAKWMVFALRLGGEAAQEVSPLLPGHPGPWLTSGAWTTGPPSGPAPAPDLPVSVRAQGPAVPPGQEVALRWELLSEASLTQR